MRPPTASPPGYEGKPTDNLADATEPVHRSKAFKPEKTPYNHINMGICYKRKSKKNPSPPIVHGQGLQFSVKPALPLSHTCDKRGPPANNYVRFPSHPMAITIYSSVHNKQSNVTLSTLESGKRETGASSVNLILILSFVT